MSVQTSAALASEVVIVSHWLMYQLVEANIAWFHTVKQLAVQPCFGGRVGEALVLSAGLLPPQAGATRVAVMAATHSLRIRATRSETRERLPGL